MKKTLIALSVLVAAGAANASINIYSADGVTVDMKGDMEVVYKKEDYKDANPRQEIQDADLGFDIRYAVSDDLSVGAYWEFQGDSGDTTEGNNVGMGDVYVAAYSASMGTLTVGDTCTLGDGMGVGSDYQWGMSEGVDTTATFCSDEVVKYELDKGTYYLGIAHADNQFGDASQATTDMQLGARFADIDARVFYADVHSSEDDMFAFEVVYTGLESLKLEAGYYSTDGAADAGADTIGLAAEYSITEKVSVAAGWSDIDLNDASAKDYNQYFVNIDYKVAPGSVVYAEMGENESVEGSAGEKSELGYAVGVKVEF